MTAVATLLAGIRERAEKAADGPWRVEQHDLTLWVHSADEGLEAKLGYIGNRPEADAAFIAAARTDVPRLVAALEAVTGLHKPRQFDPLKDGVWFGQSDFDYEVCDHCVMTQYPCPTITAVTAALGGGE